MTASTTKLPTNDSRLEPSEKERCKGVSTSGFPSVVDLFVGILGRLVEYIHPPPGGVSGRYLGSTGWLLAAVSDKHG